MAVTLQQLVQLMPCCRKVRSQNAIRTIKTANIYVKKYRFKRTCNLTTLRVKRERRRTLVHVQGILNFILKKISLAYFLRCVVWKLVQLLRPKSSSDLCDQQFDIGSSWYQILCPRLLSPH